MIVYDFFTALVIALIIGLIFSGFRLWGPWDRAIWFFILLFLFTWTAGVWTMPFGPVIYGVHWLPFVFFALFLALLMSAATPPRPPAERPEDENTLAEETATFVTATIGVFFWLVVLSLVAALVVRYFVYVTA